ncbi:hypothetical protein ACVWW4_003830 [Bradyrhizobium sp. LB7.1]
MCERWVDDPYFHFFTGEEFFQDVFPHERSDLSHWQAVGDNTILRTWSRLSRPLMRWMKSILLLLRATVSR